MSDREITSEVHICEQNDQIDQHSVAMQVPGTRRFIHGKMCHRNVLRWQDRHIRELSPYDRQILDQHVRYVGDPVAIVAGENEKCVDQAIKMLRVNTKYCQQT